MSTRNPVLWPEGLFVKPQHFQQAARASEAALQQRLGSLNAAFYGFSELQLNDEYLTLGKIAITRARGIMPDGTVFDIPADLPPPPPLEIEDDGARDSEVYLCLPLRTNGGREVSWPDHAANLRYIAQAHEIKDTHSADGDLVSVDLAVPNLQLKRQTEDSSALPAWPWHVSWSAVPTAACNLTKRSTPPVCRYGRYRRYSASWKKSPIPCANVGATLPHASAGGASRVSPTYATSTCCKP